METGGWSRADPISPALLTFLQKEGTSLSPEPGRASRDLFWPGLAGLTGTAIEPQAS